jgi:hypothetical protein
MFKLPDSFEIQPPVKSAWNIPQPIIENEDEKKRLFGLELAKASPFKAACEVFPDDTNTALWCSHNWVNDPIVVAAKDKYLEAADTSQALLDKDQFARMLLNMANEKNASNTIHILDGKDRLKALELYAKVTGLIDTKADPLLTQNFVHNSMTIKLVEPQAKEKPITTIDNNEVQNQNINSPLKLKLVG